MASQHADSDIRGQPHYDKQEKVITGTGTPAEEEEEQRALDKLWNLKENAKWGKDVDVQKNAITDLARIGTPALSHLQEILSVVASKDIRDHCQDAIDRISLKTRS